MDLSYGPEYDVFRDEVRTFIQDNLDNQPKPGAGPQSEEVRQWQAKLIENGFHSRTIPT